MRSCLLRGSFVLLALVISFPSLAQQQQQSNTSGPAAGTNVQPSTAVQKENEQQRSQSGTTAQQPAGNVAGGAPGAEAKPGTEGGQPPRR